MAVVWDFYVEKQKIYKIEMGGIALLRRSLTVPKLQWQAQMLESIQFFALLTVSMLIFSDFNFYQNIETSS